MLISNFLFLFAVLLLVRDKVNGSSWSFYPHSDPKNVSPAQLGNIYLTKYQVLTEMVTDVQFSLRKLKKILLHPKERLRDKGQTFINSNVKMTHKALRKKITKIQVHGYKREKKQKMLLENIIYIRSKDCN